MIFHKTTRNKNKRYKSTTSGKPVDKQLFLLIFGLVIFGIVMVYNSSVVSAFQDFGDKYHFTKLQTMWAGIGIIAMLVTAKIPYAWWKHYAKPLLYGTLALLVLVLIPGISDQIYGARRWISISNFTFQPAELAKFSLIIYLASALSSTKPDIQKTFFTAAAVLGLIVVEPDLGTTLVLSGASLIIYWASGAPLKHFITLVFGGMLAILGIIFAAPYRAARLKTFFNPTHDPLGQSYHIRQILIALGSGGLTGLGLGQSRQKYAYLPEVTTDSIFAVIGEEIGFLGASFLLIIFLALIAKGIQIASHAPDKFSQLLATGMITWIGLQVIINTAAMVALIPLTGIPLPFISYGGSSLVITLASMGIILNISKHKK
jgi:cell division protein FtsW